MPYPSGVSQYPKGFLQNAPLHKTRRFCYLGGMDLFLASYNDNRGFHPLADLMRPKTLDDFVGQEKALGPGRPMRLLIESGRFGSLILWGPPGTGKTTLANLLATQRQAHFVPLNAVSTTVKMLRDEGELARRRRIEQRRVTIIFVDEVHRFNKGQQDVLLPFIEVGDFIFVGATTENPSYELNSALLSRCQVVVFEPLERTALRQLLERGARHFGFELKTLLSSGAIDLLIDWSGGDARGLLNGLERLMGLGLGDNPEGLPASEDSRDASVPREDEGLAGSGRGENGEGPWSADRLAGLLETRAIRYDKGAEEHYNTISAFIKSIRGSDADAGLYYLARMLAAGEDPMFIARRLVILASEDIGNADPQALAVAVNGSRAVELVGLPEGAISLAQVVTYLALAPKSNRSYLALKAAEQEVKNSGALPIPMALRSGQTSFLRHLGYGRGYHYAHDGEFGWQAQNFFPEQVHNRSYYSPSERGYEKRLREYQAWIESQRRVQVGADKKTSTAEASASVPAEKNPKS